MSGRRRRLRTQERRCRMLRRARVGVSVVGVSMIALGLRVGADDAPGRNSLGERPVRTEVPPASVLGGRVAAAELRRNSIETSPRLTLSGGGAAAEAAKFTRRFYVGLGAGLSQLEPESQDDDLTVGDDQSTGFHVYAGYDFSRWMSAEVYAADLGEAQIDFLGADVGDIDYQVYGASVIGYLYNSQSGMSIGNRRDGLFRREGLSLYARVGVGGMNNESDLDYERDHTAHLAFGGGLEYGFSNGVALRAELMAFDTDARYATISVLKRFGRVPAAAAAAPVIATLPDPEPKQRETPPPAPEPMPLGPTYNYFDFDTAELQMDAAAKLDSLIGRLSDGGERTISVAGHTDSVGSDAYNMDLSKRRADSVREYLVSKGIAEDRLSLEAYGETRPLADNATEEGRQQNRRVEITLQ